MIYDPAKHHRHSLRLKEYDYASNGLYFITLCTHNKEKLFGDISEDKISLNEYGEIAKNEWEKSPEIRKEIILHEYIIMPNHFHAIVEISQLEEITKNICMGDRLVAQNDLSKGTSTTNNLSALEGKGDRPVALTGLNKKSIGALIAGFKSSVTKQINTIRNTPGRVVWQRNYYEHIIRDENKYMKNAEYVINNALRWKDDKYFVS